MCSSNIKRDIIVDASIGRGAGNTDYLNKSFDKEYNTLPLLEIIDEKNTLGIRPSSIFICLI